MKPADSTTPLPLDNSEQMAGIPPTHPGASALLKQALALAGDCTLTIDEAIAFNLQRAGLGDAMYSVALQALCGLHFSTEEAATTWTELLKHRGEMEQALARPVSLLAAAADMLEHARPLEPRLLLLPSNLLERLTASSQLDLATGLMSEAVFRWTLANEVGRARRYRKNLTVVVTALDDLDELQEAVGEEVLEVMASHYGQLLAANLRTTDAAARAGGSLFTILLPECKVSDGRSRADSLRAQLAAEAVAFASLPEALRVTASFGVAGFPRNASDPDSLIQCALEALLRAQEMGGDRVEHD